MGSFFIAFSCAIPYIFLKFVTCRIHIFYVFYTKNIQMSDKILL